MDQQAQDPEVQKLIASRDSTARLKLQLIQLRQTHPLVSVLALEGNDDRSVYAQWIRRVAPDFEYEFLSCRGKRWVVAFRNSLLVDQAGLKSGVFFLMDRDFDDHDLLNLPEDVFLTETYSIENYLVCPVVLDETLKDELHCNAAPVVRSAVSQRFEALYAEFLRVTHSHNLRVFCARRQNIELKPLPDKIGKIARVRLDSVQPSEKPLEECIVTVDGSAILQPDHLVANFQSLAPRGRYRGKFALAFFLSLFELLRQERVDRGTDLFSSLGAVAKTGSAPTIAVLASRSPIPQSFVDFIASIRRAGERPA